MRDELFETIGLWVLGALVVYCLVIFPIEIASRKKRAREREFETYRKEMEKYLNENQLKFVQAVKNFEDRVPTEFRSIWYFLKWKSTEYEEESGILLDFDEWSKKEKYGTPLDEVDLFAVRLVSKLDYPKYVKKDLYTATCISHNEKEFHERFSEMINFFGGNYEKCALWEIHDEWDRGMEEEKIKYLQEIERIKKRLGLED